MENPRIYIKNHPNLHKFSPKIKQNHPISIHALFQLKIYKNKIQIKNPPPFSDLYVSLNRHPGAQKLPCNCPDCQLSCSKIPIMTSFIKLFIAKNSQHSSLTTNFQTAYNFCFDPPFLSNFFRESTQKHFHLCHFRFFWTRSNHFNTCINKHI